MYINMYVWAELVCGQSWLMGVDGRSESVAHLVMLPLTPGGSGPSGGDVVDLPVIKEEDEDGTLKDPGKEGDPPSAKKQPPAPPFIVGKGLPVIPSRLVAKIQKGVPRHGGVAEGQHQWLREGGQHLQEAL